MSLVDELLRSSKKMKPQRQQARPAGSEIRPHRRSESLQTDCTFQFPIPFVAARRSAMSQTYRHCSVAFVVILAVALSSCSALNWNAQGPVKVEDVYSTENITGTFLKLLAVLHELCRFCDSSSRLLIVLSVKICVANSFVPQCRRSHHRCRYKRRSQRRPGLYRNGAAFHCNHSRHSR
jgi:hypothetical protein